MDLTTLFPSLLWWHWVAGGLLLVALEMVVPGVFLLWIGLGAILTGSITVLLGITNWEIQSLLFVPLAFLSLYLGRRFIRKAAPAEDSTLNQRLAAVIGTRVVVTHPIVNGRGRVRLGDSLWTAKGPDSPVGSVVIIIGAEGTEVLVSPEVTPEAPPETTDKTSDTI